MRNSIPLQAETEVRATFILFLAVSIHFPRTAAQSTFSGSPRLPSIDRSTNYTLPPGGSTHMPGPLWHLCHALLVAVVALGAARLVAPRGRQDRQQVQRLHVVAWRPRHEAAELVGHRAEASWWPFAVEKRGGAKWEDGVSELPRLNFK